MIRKRAARRSPTRGSVRRHPAADGRCSWVYPNGSEQEPNLAATAAQVARPYVSREVSLVNSLRELFDGRMDMVRIWLNAPHPYLEGASPLGYLESGKLEAVGTLVHVMETGQPG